MQIEISLLRRKSEFSFTSCFILLTFSNCTLSELNLFPLTVSEFSV